MLTKETSNSAQIIPLEKGQLSFDFSVLSEEKQVKLQSLTSEIYATYKTTLESVLKLGQYFTEAKALIGPRGGFQDWVRTEFTEGRLGVGLTTVQNWMRVYKEFKRNPEAQRAFEELNLRVVYELCAKQVEVELRDQIYELVNQGARPSAQDFDSIRQLVRQYNVMQVAEESKLDDTVRVDLVNLPIAEDLKEIRKLGSLSKKTQRGVVELLQNQEAFAVREAVQILAREEEEGAPEEEHLLNDSEFEDEEEYDDEPILKSFSGRWQTALKKVPAEELDLLIAEAPMRYSWVEDKEGLSRLGQLAYDTLRPGGLLIATVGHKAVMFSGPALAPLKPLHVLVLRRLPGHTRAIVGTNIASPSVLCILAYKPPFRARSSMVVDLQSWGGEDPLPGLEEIPSGIERGFDQFLLSLVEPGDYVAHVVCGSAKEQFGIRESLKASSLSAGAGAFLSIG